MSPNAHTTKSAFTPSLRRVACALAAAMLASSALAGDPPSATYPQKFSFASTKVAPTDVAIYAPVDQSKFTYVADSGPVRRLLRFQGVGAGAPSAIGGGFTGVGYPQMGIAVNDKPGSLNFGEVVATDVWFGIGVLRHFDTNLAPIGMSAPGASPTAWMLAPVDTAFDESGALYVADAATRKVYRYDAQVVAGRGFLPPTHTYGNGFVAPNGVSVDHNGRVHVSYENSGLYEIFDPSGALVAGYQNNLTRNYGVCALHPCADGFLPRATSQQYEFTRFDWDWIGLSGAFDLSAGVNQIARPAGIEYQKFIYPQYGLPGWTPVRSDERVYVCSMKSVEVFGQSYHSVPVPSGLRAWWRFDDKHEFFPFEVAGQIDDCVGPNDATAGAVVPRTVEGMVRCALDTRGGTAFATAPDGADLNFGSGSLSIEGWLRSEQRTGVITVLDKRVGTGAGYSVYLHQGRVGFQTNIGTGFQNFTSSTVIADGRWRHFAVVLDRDSDDTLTIYVDGVAAGSTSALAGNVDTTGSLYFGRVNAGAGGTPLIGAIDEITLYDEPLSAADVAGLAEARSAGKHVWVSPGE